MKDTMHHKTRAGTNKTGWVKRSISNGLPLVHIRKRNRQKKKNQDISRQNNPPANKENKGSYMFVSVHNPIHETVDWSKGNLKPETSYFTGKPIYHHIHYHIPMVSGVFFSLKPVHWMKHRRSENIWHIRKIGHIHIFERSRTFEAKKFAHRNPRVPPSGCSLYFLGSIGCPNSDSVLERASMESPKWWFNQI